MQSRRKGRVGRSRTCAWLWFLFVQELGTAAGRRTPKNLDASILSTGKVVTPYPFQSAILQGYFSLLYPPNRLLLLAFPLLASILTAIIPVWDNAQPLHGWAYLALT